jgi:hypothetical protein
MGASPGLPRMGTRVEMPRMVARREVARIAACREVSRIAARVEAAGIAGCLNLIRSRDQQGAARRRQPPEPHNHAHKMRRESQPFREIRK